MEGFCTRCGDCCEGISLASAMTKDEFINKCIEVEVDPGTAELVIDHWEPLEEDPTRFNCNYFDSKKRLCTHPNRPYICTGFPWYGREPENEVPLSPEKSKRCGFWLDTPEENRPKNFLPVV